MSEPKKPSNKSEVFREASRFSYRLTSNGESDRECHQPTSLFNSLHASHTSGSLHCHDISTISSDESDQLHLSSTHRTRFGRFSPDTSPYSSDNSIRLPTNRTDKFGPDASPNSPISYKTISKISAAQEEDITCQQTLKGTQVSTEKVHDVCQNSIRFCQQKAVGNRSREQRFEKRGFFPQGASSFVGGKNAKNKGACRHLNSKDVRCEVCNRVIVRLKYRRHLQLHLKNGAISLDDINLMVFNSKPVRKDSNNSRNSIKPAYICKFPKNGRTCGKYVFDLRVHLIQTHKLNSSGELFTKLFNSAVKCRRNSEYCLYNSKRVESLNTSTDNIVDKPFDDHSDLSNSDFSFVSEHSSLPDHTHVCIHKSMVSSLFSKAVELFRKFQSSTWGGSCTSKSIETDVTNLISIYDFVGEDHFFDHDKINEYLTSESSDGKAPTTLLCKIHSVRRFLKCLEIKFPKFLPSCSQLCIFFSMLSGIEKTLLKRRNMRQRMIMECSRTNYDKSISVLRSWRSIRNEPSHQILFDHFRDNIEYILTRSNYEAMRDFLITDILLTNSQRPGVIIGMILNEVDAARYDVVKGYHRVIVSRHKTGHLQSAVLFVYPIIYQALHFFSHQILTKLPSFILPDNSSLFPIESGKDKIFLGYNGLSLISSQISPILKKTLSTNNIPFSVTATDLRKASATLTAEFRPEMQSSVSDFLCHSRQVHDKLYRIQHGGKNIVEAFETLESVQTQPHNSTIQPSFDGNSNFSNSDVSSFNHILNSTVDKQIEPDSCYTTSNHIVEEENNLYSDSHDINLNNDIEGLDHINTSTNPSSPLLKDCRICLPRVCSTPSSQPTESNVHSNVLESTICLPHHKSIFNLKKEEDLFKRILHKFIERVKLRKFISQKCVTQYISSQKELQPVISSLQCKFPNRDIDQMLYIKVRTLGMSLRTSI